VRHLIDQATLDSLEGVKRHVKKAAPTIPTQDSTVAQVAGLENEIQQLQSRLNIEELYRLDTRSHHFKRWLRTHDQSEGTEFFFKHYLVGDQLPEHASRGLYEAKLRTAGYLDENLHLFQDVWKTMLIDSEWKYEASRDHAPPRG
jgi:hypothetical protein